MTRMDPVPEGSIYFWMYTQGLKGLDLDDLLWELAAHGKAVRQKDVDNYWNGVHRSNVYRSGTFDIRPKVHDATPSRRFEDMTLLEYPGHPYGDEVPEISERWVPCNAANKPMIKWGRGCMSKVDAESMIGQVYLAENLKGTRMIVLDFDGDHDEAVDWETVCFGHALHELSGTLMHSRPGEITPVSFHLTFSTNRIIPTMHFPEARIDVVGNKENSLRYFKNKRPDKNPIKPMTGEVWDLLRDYVRKRRNK